MPISSVAICVEGALQKSSSNAPLPIAVAIYHSLKTNFNILLYSEQSREAVDYWLSIESLTIHAAVEYNEGSRQWLSDPERKLVQLNSLRQRGYNIEIVIEPDPQSAAVMVVNGFNVLNFIHAQYALPQFRPDFPGHYKPWDELYDVAVQQAELRALDLRLKEKDDDTQWD